MNLNVQCAVTVNIECAHRNKLGKIHGHSYLIEVWFDAGPDLDMTKCAVDQVIAAADHSQLEDSIGGSSMEELAAWVFSRVDLIGNGGLHVNRVVVRRPTLGYIVEAHRT